MRPRISRLYLDNYRCFVNFELRPEGRSLLLGYNGTGKSSLFDVLDAIQSLTVMNADVTEVFPPGTLSMLGDSREQRFEIDVESPWGTFTYALHLRHSHKHGVTTIASEAVTLGGKPLYTFTKSEVQLYDDDHQPSGSPFSFQPRRSFLSSLEPRPKTSRLASLTAFFTGIGVLRLDPSRMSGAAPDESPQLARDGSNFASFCRHLLAEYPEAMQRARDALREILSGFESVRAHTVGRSRVLVVKFNVAGGVSYEIDFDALSDGQKILIALYVLVHAVPDHLSLLCLDEPDNFVSIREIQPFLVELIKQKEDGGLRALLISHSAEVIDFFGPSESILLERPDGGHVRIGAVAPDGTLRLSELMARGWHAALIAAREELLRLH